MKKKLRVGWFTFTCCEDSTIIFTELLNRHFQEWREKLEFIHAKVLQSGNRFVPMDVAFVEGAISSYAQEEKLKRIRGLSTRLVAIGACACIGMPSSQRNSFDAPTTEEIRGLLLRFNQSDRVKTVASVVAVDESIQGCPMSEDVFLAVMNRYLGEFGIGTPRVF